MTKEGKDISAEGGGGGLVGSRDEPWKALECYRELSWADDGIKCLPPQFTLTQLQLF